MSATLALTRGLVALVDDDDVALVAPHHWWADSRDDRRTYARATIDGRRVYLHRFLAGRPGLDVDHWNGDGLDNRRENLRVATRAENLRNARHGWRRHGQPTSSKFKGVSLHRPGRWVAYIGSADRRKIHLGVFDSEAAAAQAYDVAALRLFGEFAATNAALGRLA